MSLIYTDQPKLSDAEAAEFLMEHGMHLSEWPQVLLPQQILDGYKEQVLGNAGFLKDQQVDIALLNSITENSLTEARQPQAVLRTEWGVLVAWYSDNGDDCNSFMTVEIHCEKAWGHSSLGREQQNFIELMADLIEFFRESQADNGKRLRGKIILVDSFIGALCDVMGSVRPRASERTKELACAETAKFFVAILRSGLLKQNIDTALHKMNLA